MKSKSITNQVKYKQVKQYSDKNNYKAKQYTRKKYCASYTTAKE